MSSIDAIPSLSLRHSGLTMQSRSRIPETGGFTTPPFLGPIDGFPPEPMVRLLPVPMEATVSYGGGTAGGPRAILEASAELELYDREFGCEPAMLYGVETLPIMALSEDPAQAIEEIVARVGEVFQPGVLLGVLGGEHSLTAAVVRGVLTHLEGPITVVQFDAHCDLRASYQGSPHSHASVSSQMLKLPQVEQILQLGIRSLCQEEADVLARESRVRAWFSEDVEAGGYEQELLERVRGKRLYVTIDVDCLDPSLVSSTGTPEPNGLLFRQVESILKLLSDNAEIVAFDCVELAPVEGHHASDFVVSKLVYRAMNLFLQKHIAPKKGTN